MKLLLNTKTIDAIRAPTREEAGSSGYVIHWDTLIPGYGLLVTVAGVKSFILKYRNGKGASRRLTLGRYGFLNADTARKAAQQAAGKVALGLDPHEDKQAQRMTASMSELFDKYLAGRYPEATPTKTAATNALKHARRLYGRIAVDEIESSDIVKAIDKIKEKPGVIQGMVAYTSAAWNWGRLRKLVPANRLNPCEGVPVPKGMSRKQDISDEEFARIGAALDRILEQGKVDRSRTLAIMMCLYSGCRPIEALRMIPDDIKADRGMIVLAKHKTAEKTGRPKLIFITPEVQGVLDAAAKLREVSGNQTYVFPRNTASESAVWYERAWNAIRREANVPHLQLYNLRSAFITVASDELELADTDIQEITQHSSIDVLQSHYKVNRNRKAANNAARMTKLLADKLKAGQPKEKEALPDNVVRLRA